MAKYVHHLSNGKHDATKNTQTVTLTHTHTHTGTHKHQHIYKQITRDSCGTNARGTHTHTAVQKKFVHFQYHYVSFSRVFFILFVCFAWLVVVAFRTIKYEKKAGGSYSYLNFYHFPNERIMNFVHS